MLRDKLNKKNLGQRLPVFPAWVYERPTLVGDFLTGAGAGADAAVPVGTQSVHCKLPARWPQGQLALCLEPAPHQQADVCMWGGAFAA